MRCSAQAINSVTEVDARQIAREDLLLGQPRLEPESDDHFLRFALDRAVAGQEIGLSELLGDGAASLAHAPAPHVRKHRAADPTWVDTPVPVEAPVLDRDERGRSEWVELGDVDRGFLDRPAAGDRLPIVTEQQKRRIVERLERT